MPDRRLLATHLRRECKANLQQQPRPIERFPSLSLTSALVIVLLALFAPEGDARKGAMIAAEIRYGKTSSGYQYMNGGARRYQRESLERRSAPYNIKFVLVPPRAMRLPSLGIFIANNATGTIERITLSGPWIYFRLPPGTYTIGARIGDRFFLLRNVYVRDKRRQTHILKGNLFHSIMDRPR